MMESVDKLRKSLQACRRTEKTEKPFDTYWITASACDILIDEIEQELADRFVALPLDKDGEPWHIGDMVDGHGKVRGMGLNMAGRYFVSVDNAIVPELYRHAEPRTLEDVLEEFIAAYDEWDCNTYDDERMAGRRELFAKYADELRELMGVD